MINYSLKEINVLSNSITRLILLPLQEKINYQAGQYIELYCPDQGRLPFSIANAPQQDGMLELHIRHLDEDQGVQELLAGINQKKTLSVIGPFGECIYQHALDFPIILMAGGTGITQIKAIVEAAIERNDQRHFYLYWGVRHLSDFYLPELLLSWVASLTYFQFQIIVSQPDTFIPPFIGMGYVQTKVLRDFQNLSAYQVYASGPWAMSQAAYKRFVARGLRPEYFYSDAMR